MSHAHLRKEVLKQFKNLHRTTQIVFFEDNFALEKARNKIREGFKEKKEVTDNKEIQELIKFATDVQLELRTNVIQAIQKKPDVFELRLREETMLDNVLFDPNAKIPEKPRKGKRCPK